MIKIPIRKMRLAAIHQPNFFPWLGFFNKIHRTDVFILLDDIQMVKTGSSWFNRCNLLINGKAQFFTIPVSRPSGTVLISDAKINDPKWKNKLISTLEMAYGRHPHYPENIGPILDLIEGNSDSLAEFNINVITHFRQLFSLDNTQIIRSSSYKISSASTQRLIDLVKLSGCDSYLEGGGASGYQEDGLFHSQGITLLKQNFVHPTYPQRGNPEFQPGLSILDPLFNCGVDVTRKLIMADIQ